MRYLCRRIWQVAPRRADRQRQRGPPCARHVVSRSAHFTMPIPPARGVTRSLLIVQGKGGADCRNCSEDATMLRRILFILTVPAMVLTPHARAVSEIAAKRIAVTSGALVCPFAPVKVSRHP